MGTDRDRRVRAAQFRAFERRCQAIELDILHDRGIQSVPVEALNGEVREDFLSWSIKIARFGQILSKQIPETSTMLTETAVHLSSPES